MGLVNTEVLVVDIKEQKYYVLKIVATGSRYDGSVVAYTRSAGDLNGYNGERVDISTWETRADPYFANHFLGIYSKHMGNDMSSHIFSMK